MSTINFVFNIKIDCLL